MHVRNQFALGRFVVPLAADIVLRYLITRRNVEHESPPPFCLEGSVRAFFLFSFSFYVV